jgi:small subunit ribosomal protein S9
MAKTDNNTEKTQSSTNKYTYTIGRRKTAVASVRLFEGKGENTLNGKKLEQLLTPKQLVSISRPLKILELSDKYYWTAKVSGGGITGMVDSIVLGISRALVKLSDSNKQKLKLAGLLTRDDRMVESKKVGLRKARKRDQYSKR